MMGKLKWLAGFGAGYVLGARAGRERYAQIAARAQELWSDPRVQEKAGQAQQALKEKADQAQQAVKDKVGKPATSPGPVSRPVPVDPPGPAGRGPARAPAPALAPAAGVIVSQATDPQHDRAVPGSAVGGDSTGELVSRLSRRSPSWCATSSGWPSSR